MAAPPQATFDKLLSWSEHTDTGIKYLQRHGYVPQDLRRAQRATGQRTAAPISTSVRSTVMAEVNLNGRDWGSSGNSPTASNAAAAIRPGKNVLIVKVVNLWVNRLIGDEQLPDNAPGHGQTCSQWPQWLLDGKPSPTGRYTFTSHRLWKKGDRLLPPACWAGNAACDAVRPRQVRIGGTISSVEQVANLPLDSGFSAEQAGWQPARPPEERQVVFRRSESAKS